MTTKSRAISISICWSRRNQVIFAIGIFLLCAKLAPLLTDSSENPPQCRLTLSISGVFNCSRQKWKEIVPANRVLAAILIKIWLRQRKIEKKSKMCDNRPPFLPSDSHALISTPTTPLTHFVATLYCNWETINDNYANQNLHFEDIFLLPVNSGPLILRPSATLFGI